MILVRVGYLHESGMIHSYPFCTGDYSNTTIDVDLLVSYIDAVTKKHDIKKNVGFEDMYFYRRRYRSI